MRQLRFILEIQPADQLVDVRAIGLHNVVGQRKGVVAVPVENAERREQTRAHQRAGYGRAQDRIAVIQQVVRLRALANTDELLAEKLRPVYSGGGSFAIIRIAALDVLVAGFQFVSVFAQLAQQGGLVADFRFDDLLPQILFQRLARFDLRPVALALRSVGVEIHQHGVGHPVAVAKDDGYVAIRQGVQQRERDGRLLVLEHDDADVLDRNAFPEVGSLFRRDNQLIVSQTQAEGRGEEERALEHGYSCLNRTVPVTLSSKSKPST